MASRIREAELLARFPADRPVVAAEVAAAAEASGAVLVVLDDDPTGTQAVHDVLVLTRGEVEDFRWAFATLAAGGGPRAVFVEVNTRSLDPAEAAELDAAVVRAAVAAARETGARLRLVSRGDSTLRGHFPLETDAIAAALAGAGEPGVDGVLLVPAFPEAGRVTIGGTHYLREPGGGLLPAGDSEFARDATFGYASSRLADYVEEKSGGRSRAADVAEIGLDAIRAGAEAVARLLAAARGGRPIVADAVTEGDLLTLAHGLLLAEERGATILVRSGPSFVRALLGQEPRAPLAAGEVFASGRAATRGGLVVVGSHVGVTTRQLARLREARPDIAAVELDVESLLADPDPAATRDRLAAGLVARLAEGDVVLHTSRAVRVGRDAAESLAIARAVSETLVAVVAGVVDAVAPRFVVAKGGITSSDVASRGLRMNRARVRGPMLPGIVSLWESADGPALGVPYVVFAGNVGDDEALRRVVETLSA